MLKCGYMHKKKSFTLIEVLIVVLIIGILVALSTPLFNGFIMKAQLSEVLAVASSFENQARLIVLECGWNNLPAIQAGIELPQSRDFYYRVHGMPPHLYTLGIVHVDIPPSPDPQGDFANYFIVNPDDPWGYQNGWYINGTSLWARYLRAILPEDAVAN